MSNTHRCPDCQAQLPGETTLEQHKEAAERALERHKDALYALRKAEGEGVAFTIDRARELVEQTHGLAHVAAPCIGIDQAQLRPDLERWGESTLDQERRGERETTPGRDTPPPPAARPQHGMTFRPGQGWGGGR